MTAPAGSSLNAVVVPATDWLDCGVTCTTLAPPAPVVHVNRRRSGMRSMSMRTATARSLEGVRENSLGRAPGPRSRPLVVALPATWRATMSPTAAGAVAGGGLVWLLRPADDAGGPGSLAGLRLAGLLVCTGAAFVLDDPAAPTLAGSPTNPPRRRGLRLGLLGAALALVWAGLLVLAALVAEVPLSELPVATATLEAAAILALVLAVAAVVARDDPSTGGAAGGAGLVLTMLIALLGQRLWPEHLTLFPFGPEDPAEPPPRPLGRPAGRRHHRPASPASTATVPVSPWSYLGVPPECPSGAHPSIPHHHMKETQ